MNTNITEMAMELKQKLKAYKVFLQFGYFTRDNVWLK